MGYGIYVPSTDAHISSRITDDTDVFSAEARAIWAAIQATADDPIAPTLILSDSLSVLTAIQNQSSSPAIQDIILQLSLAQNSHRDITLVWIPAHCGIRGNEVVDSLAKEALEHDAVDDPIPHTLNNHYSAVRKYITHKWQREWSDSRHPLRHCLPEVKVSMTVFDANRQMNRLVYQFALNIAPLNEFFSMLRGSDPACPACRIASENRDHFLFHCPTYTRERQKLIRALQSTDTPFSWKGVLSPSGCEAFTEFIKATGRFNS
jgi:ribonuclease HI